MAFLRARNKEQKQERVEEIVAAAAELYSEVGYDKVTFSKIAARLNYTRITLYNYFACKEDIFLLLMEQDLEKMAVDAAAVFTDRCADTDTFLNQWVQLMLRHQRLLSLMSIVNTIILKGASDGSHEHYRRRLNEVFLRLGDCVITALPGMKKAEVIDFLDIENSYCMAMYAASLEYKKAHAIKVFPHAGYGTVGFEKQLKKMLVKILPGFLEEKEKMPEAVLKAV